MSYFSNKVVVVTGGSDGIGKALVEKLLEQGATVATCGRNHDKLYQLQLQQTGRPLFTMSADIGKEADCKKFIDTVAKTYGRIDVLINNAGISMRAMFQELELETLRQLMDVNFWGTVYCTRYALPEIIKTKGTITGILSVAAFRGLPGRTGYSASKFAVNGFLEALRTEVMNEGVNVMWVYPGFVSSNIRNAALNQDAKPQGKTPMNEAEMMTPEECADKILFSIRKRHRSLILTSLAKRTLFMTRFLPQVADKMIRKFYFKEGKLIK
ncbi:SDR family oxidoreductase [Aridibaculum aurantiacum]|uniref:SDR family oxidoreductase n=1 Tax=Aridibaculum aurantiacum TaxID=2810307 RepID=UPI001A96C074|nr:SDR family oxidoreductase [Aridibaculum aurantiacum]